MKKSDKVIYIMIKVIGIITIVIISYFIILATMNLMNTTEYSKILIDMNMYRPFYVVLNLITQMAIPILLIALFIAIPYLIIILILCIIFIKKYIKYHREKKKQILKIIILGVLTICFVIKGISLLPLTAKYEIEVNAKVNEVSNDEIRSFLQKEIMENMYIYKIEIMKSFPDDYNVKIHYQDITKKIKDTFLSDNDYDFINRNAKNITNELTIKSIIITLVGDALFTYSLILVLNEFKRISIINKK